MLIFILIPSTLVLLLLVFILIGVWSYRIAFQARFEGGGDYYPYFSQLHPSWQRRAVSFPSQQGDTLRGHLFFYDGPQKALIVLCHGYGMSLNDYLPECEYFCRNGYTVLAFDGSGTGISDGVLRGLPQHILDLAACLDYVSSNPDLNTLPLLLYGHSWGGYSVDCVHLLGHYPVQGIISASAFQISTAGLKPHMQRHWGIIAPLPMLGVTIYQRWKFGPLVGATAVEGLARTEAPVLILQSRDDGIIRYQDNYEVLYAAFREDPKKTFLPLEHHNHNITTPPEVDQEKRKLLKYLRSGTASQAQLAEMDALKAQVDEGLLARFVSFYDNCIQ